MVCLLAGMKATFEISVGFEIVFICFVDENIFNNDFVEFFG